MTLLAALVGLPGTAAAVALLWGSALPPLAVWTLTALLVTAWTVGTLLLRQRVIRPLQTLANLLAALREGDFSIRASAGRTDDALGLALTETNLLAEILREQRLGALEATALLRTVMSEIDVVVLAFDARGTLRLVNRAGERLLGRPSPRLLGETAEELGLDVCLYGEAPRTLDAAFPGGSGRWELRRGMFRQHGEPHQLVVLSDLSRALREEERQAWQRLVRVLGHEINNSLAPIQSIAGSLHDLVVHTPRPEDWEEDLEQGLNVIRGRSGALGRFMAAYAKLTRLPQPKLEPLRVQDWVNRVARLERRLDVRVRPGPDVVIQADGDQLDQLLINLTRNAADAALETGGGVEIGWTASDGHLEVRVRDDGPGIADTSNLFVPFFTTKPKGSGIGLALSRQIAEAHGGSLTLHNRQDAGGAEARVVLQM